jgi:AcrR family transcriptional regulator
MVCACSDEDKTRALQPTAAKATACPPNRRGGARCCGGILKRQGVEAVTTNRIAEVAGVSIGSVYQYFPDKRAIYIALHQRHLQEIDRLVETKLIEHSASPLEKLIRAMVEAMVEAHATDPKLYELLLTEVPHRAEGTRDFAVRLHGAFRLAIASRVHELKSRP